MNPVDYKGWGLNEAICPCDIHLLEWLADKPALSVLHMGTGLHHSVGLRHPGFVTGITYSDEEAAEWARLVNADDELLERYRLVHGDIYTLSLGEMDRFDVISLPHIGEFYPAGNHNPQADIDLLSMLALHLNHGGNIVFYNGSYAMTWQWLRDAIKTWSEKDGFYRSDGFKSLSMFSRK